MRRLNKDNSVEFEAFGREWLENENIINLIKLLLWRKRKYGVMDNSVKYMNINNSANAIRGSSAHRTKRLVQHRRVKIITAACYWLEV
jgi:hypothetical protein